MTGALNTLPLNPNKTLLKAEGSMPLWLTEISTMDAHKGFYQNLGQHAVSFVDQGTHQLVISFDNLSDAGNPRYDVSPWASAFVMAEGWSHLGVYARGPSWFRDQQLIDCFAKLQKTGFFKQFDNVALIGTSMGGFAALSFASFVPNATVVSLSPQSTLDEKLVPWEPRFAKGRKGDWTLPCSDASKTISKIKKAYVLFDPYVELDLKHVDRLPEMKLIKLKAFWFGHKTAVVLRRLDTIKPFMRGAIQGTLTEAEFYAMIRGRKDLLLYRRNMEAHLEAKQRDTLMSRFRFAFRRRRQGH